MTKEFFKEHGVAFTEYDVATDVDKRNELFQKVGGPTGVPVIFIDDEMVIGFDEDKLRELLDIK